MLSPCTLGLLLGLARSHLFSCRGTRHAPGQTHTLLSEPPFLPPPARPLGAGPDLRQAKANSEGLMMRGLRPSVSIIPNPKQHKRTSTPSPPPLLQERCAEEGVLPPAWVRAIDFPTTLSEAIGARVEAATRVSRTAWQLHLSCLVLQLSAARQGWRLQIGIGAASACAGVHVPTTRGSWPPGMLYCGSYPRLYCLLWEHSIPAKHA